MRENGEHQWDESIFNHYKLIWNCYGSVTRE